VRRKVRRQVAAGIAASAASGNVRGVYSEQIGQQSSRATFPRMAEPREFEGSFETRLSKPPEEVYAFLVDLPQTPRWRFHLGSVSWIDDGETCVGRRFSVQLSFGPWRKMALQGEVTVYEPPMRFSYRITDGPLKAENEYVVTPDGAGGAFFTMTGRAGMPGILMRVASPLITRAYGRTTRRELRRLSEILA